MASLVLNMDAIPFENHVLRMLGKPQNYDGSESKWRDWKFIFVAHVSNLSPEMAQEMTAAEAARGEIDIDLINEEARPRCRALYTILSTLWVADA